VGRSAFVRWLALAFATTRRSNTGADESLVQQAVQRARMCELVGRTAGHRDGGSLFLVGLFSLLDAVFRMPLHELLDRVRLSPEVHTALLDRAGPFAGVLELVESYELGLWEGAAENAARLGVRYEMIPELYSEALLWAAQQVVNR
jgi:EAL and modified HD-GYP domain-containing signal transduction protein